jgi:hypothetical protein
MNDAPRWDPEVVGEWIAKHRRSAPAAWVAIAESLRRSKEMAQVWSALAADGMHPMQVFSVVRHAVADAAKEFQRLPSKAELASLARVKRAALQLKRMIEQSPLPSDWGSHRTLTQEGLPQVPVVIGWRGLSPDGHGLGYSIAIVDVLDLAVELVEQHEAKLARRSVPRRKDGTPGASAVNAAREERVRMLVRWLTYRIKHKTGKLHRASVARIANAVLRLSQPIDADRVKLIWKDAPAEFQRTRRRVGGA